MNTCRYIKKSDCKWFAQIAQDKWATVSKLLRCSEELSDRERIAQVAQDKWATVSELLRSLKTNDQFAQIFLAKSKILFLSMLQYIEVFLI